MSNFPAEVTPREPLAVIGLSCLFPKAADVAEFWSNIRRGVDAITEIPSTHWNPDDYFDADPKSPDMTYARRGGFLSPVAFDPLEFGIAPSNLEAIDTSQLLGLVGAKRALEDAGYGSDRQFDRSRIGCILGVTGTLEMVIPLGARLGHPKWRAALKDAGVADDVAEDVIQRISESYVPWQENSFPGLLGNVVAGRIANRLDLGGTNCVVDAACASSLSAMHLAALELWSGRAEMMITGGIDTFNDIFMYMCFSKTPALSPTGNAKPFSDDGDGTILGEGVGMFVLKRLSDAERDGDRIHTVIRGIGTSSDGAGNAVYAPKKEGQVRCLQDAYDVAGVSPSTVELIEAHGTGTKVGDATELAGLTEVFQSTDKTGRWCAVGSVKSQIGHTKAAAGAAGVLKAILALKHRVLPPTIKIDRPLPALLEDGSPLYANTQARPWLPNQDHPRRAGVSAFGFGGSNFHCVLEESQTAPEIDWDDDVLLAAWSADSLEDLSNQLSEWKNVSDRREIRQRAAQSRRQFQSSHEHRLLLAVDFDAVNVPQLIASAQNNLQKYADRSHWATPDGVIYGRGSRSGKLGLLFPGQGSQYVGMQRELACRFPMLMDVLAEANDVFAEYAPHQGRERLSDYIYPMPAFDDQLRDRQEAALRDTEVAQPALGAVSLGLLAVLAEFGIRPEVVAGHSYGELSALCASRRFAPRSLYRLSMLRGRLMAEAQEVDGGMLAVGAPLSQVEAALKEAEIDLVIANRNGPSQVVLSGRVTELDRAHETLARRNIRGKRLPVAAAFHSPLVASAGERFRAVLEEIEFSAADVPVFANTHAEEYPADPAEARSLLAGQLAQPVEFVRQIENMYDAGVRLFLEVGPGAVLTGLVGSILSGRDYRSVAVDSSSGKRSGMLDLALTFGHLSAAGYGVDLTVWDPLPETAAASANGSPRMTVPICGANYVKPRTAKPPVRREPIRSEPTPPAPIPSAPTPIPSAPVSREAQPISVTKDVRPALPAPRHAMTNPPPALAVLLQMQEQTAQLHRQFLEGQDAALRTLESLARGGRESIPETRGKRQEVENERPVARDLKPVAKSDLRAENQILAPRPLPPAAPPALPPSTVDQRLMQMVLDVVAEKTGYPAEMLKPEMSLDHDLGIDSIKRVEILSALQERRPDLPAVAPEQLGTLHRLEDVIALLGQEVRGERQEENRSLSTRLSPLAPLPDAQLTQTVLEVVAEKTGYPAEMLKPEMSLDHDLGIDSIKRVEILSALQERRPDLPAVKPEQLGTLHRLEDVIALLGQEASGERREENEALPSRHSPLATRPITQLSLTTPRLVPLQSTGRRRPIAPGASILVVGDKGDVARGLSQRLQLLGFRPQQTGWDAEARSEPPNNLAGLVIVSPEQGISDSQLWQALHWVQQCGLVLRRQRGAILATISRLDGGFGLLAESKTADPLSGALSGLAKTARHEWPEVCAKAIDLAAGSLDNNAVLAQLVDQLLCEGPAEIGFTGDSWQQIDVVEQSVSKSGTPPVEPGELVVITGGARGVTAACAIAVAQAWRPHLLLCGRTPLTEEPDWLRSLETAPQIKQALVKQSPSAASPRQVEQECRRILANRDVESTLEAIRALGVTVDYAALDVRDADAVRHCLQDAQQKLGPIRGVVHGAGVLEDRRIEDKTREQFENVFETKVSGWRNILAALDPAELRCVALFSSSTGRFGRTGQVDYAMANEALNKLAGQFQAEHSGCRVRSFNWGPWNGGMVTDSLKPLFAQEGIGLIPLDAGAQLLVRELEQPNVVGSVELVVLAGLEAESETGKEARGERQEEKQFLPTRHSPLASSPSADLTAAVLEVVAEKTGYPAEMLKPGMSLDHDLGIDSIKRVEILSALQERRPDLPAVAPEQLGTLHRLEDVIALLGQEVRGERQEKNESLATRPSSISALPDPQLTQIVLEVVAEKTGYPAEMLKPGMSLDHDLGIDSIKRVEILSALQERRPDLPAVKPEQLGTLHRLEDVIALLGQEATAERREESQIPAARQPASSSPVSSNGGRCGWERTISLASHPYLESHVIGGKAVLPTAMILECLAHGALHHHPGLEFAGLDNLRIFKGVRLGRQEQLALLVMTMKPSRENDTFRVPARLVQAEHGRELLHAQADILLSPARSAAPKSKLLASLSGSPVSRPMSWYDSLLFHGDRLHGLTSIAALSGDGIIVQSQSAAAPASWLAEPWRSDWLADPLAVDVALQALIVWTQATAGLASLPTAIAGYRQYRRSFPSDGLQIAIRAHRRQEAMAVADVEILDANGAVIATLSGVEHVLDGQLQEAFRRNRVE